MTRFMALAYAVATVLAFSTAPAAPVVEVDTVIVAQAATPEAALQAAWEKADQELDRQCHQWARGAKWDETGTEQVSPVDGGFSAEVYAGAKCR
ncbi:MAG: hypothetical protein R3F61_20700 [Myxococcota bacterium]